MMMINGWSSHCRFVKWWMAYDWAFNNIVRCANSPTTAAALQSESAEGQSAGKSWRKTCYYYFRFNIRAGRFTEHLTPVQVNLMMGSESSFCNTRPTNDDRSLKSAERLTQSGGRPRPPAHPRRLPMTSCCTVFHGGPAAAQQAGIRSSQDHEMTNWRPARLTEAEDLDRFTLGSPSRPVDPIRPRRPPARPPTSIYGSVSSSFLARRGVKDEDLPGAARWAISPSVQTFSCHPRISATVISPAIDVRSVSHQQRICTEPRNISAWRPIASELQRIKQHKYMHGGQRCCSIGGYQAAKLMC